MRHINTKIDTQTQQQTNMINNRKDNGQFNHYRFKQELDRHKKR